MVVGEITPASVNDAEAQLVQRAKERSPSAWAEIYDRYYRKLYRYCYARTGSDAAAADLASRVYLEAIEGIEWYTYRGKPLLAWLYRIARNIVVDYLRNGQRERDALERLATQRSPAAPGLAQQVTDREALRQAMAQLTDEQQQLVALRFFAGCTTEEIAHALEKSERAVYSMEVRALASLRRLLGPDAAPDAQRRVA
jgi:RNA polymerase sigma-70 factor (ECF subfamily)